LGAGRAHRDNGLRATLPLPNDGKVQKFLLVEEALAAASVRSRTS